MSRFEMNPGFAGQFVRESEELRSTVRKLGERVLLRAQALAAPHAKTGHYLKSLAGDLNYNDLGHPYYRVASDDEAAASIEFGDDNQPGQRILGRAIGERLDE